MTKLFARTTWIVVGLLVMALVTGCTLSGAEEPPLTPVGDTGLPTNPPATPTVETLPATPTTAGPIDVFGTQTAQAVFGTPGEVGGQTPVGTEEGGEVPIGTPQTTPGAIASPTAPVAATAQPTSVAQGTAGPCPPTHTVAAGENLFRIAMKYNLTWQELAAANGITNPASLQVGQVLNIPGCGQSAETGGGSATAVPGSATTHTVQPGENLFRIAMKYGVTWQELAAYNNITDPGSLQVGQVLQIPPAD
jgi:LysM repeat protein